MVQFFNLKKFFLKGIYVINNSRFSECKSYNLGGVFSIIEGSLLIIDSIFTKNSAKRGGVIYYLCSLKNKHICSLNLTNNLFSDNKALINGGVIYWKYVKPFIFKIILVNNSAKYGPSYSSFYLTTNFSAINTVTGKVEYTSNLNKTLFLVNNLSPLEKIPLNFEFSLLDVYQQKIKEILLPVKIKIEVDLEIQKNFETLNISNKLLQNLLIQNKSNTNQNFYKKKRTYNLWKNL